MKNTKNCWREQAIHFEKEREEICASCHNMWQLGWVADKGEILEAGEGYKPSSEIKMHLRCYADRPDVGGVRQAHPPVATGYAVANKPLDEYLMIETVIAIGSIPVTPYGTPSTHEVPNAIAPYLAQHDVVLLQNHGASRGGERADRLLPHGNTGAVRQNIPECPPAGGAEETAGKTSTG